LEATHTHTLAWAEIMRRTRGQPQTTPKLNPAAPHDLCPLLLAELMLRSFHFN